MVETDAITSCRRAIALAGAGGMGTVGASRGSRQQRAPSNDRWLVQCDRRTWPLQNPDDAAPLRQQAYPLQIGQYANPEKSHLSARI